MRAHTSHVDDKLRGKLRICVLRACCLHINYNRRAAVIISVWPSIANYNCAGRSDLWVTAAVAVRATIPWFRRAWTTCLLLLLHGRWREANVHVQFPRAFSPVGWLTYVDWACACLRIGDNGEKTAAWDCIRIHRDCREEISAEPTRIRQWPFIVRRGAGREINFAIDINLITAITITAINVIESYIGIWEVLIIFF